MAIKVLLVDDEKDFVEILAERMMARGLNVDTAGSGSEGIKKARKKGFDAIVLDMAMPGMDGIATLKELLKMNPDLQVILLTGRATMEKSFEAAKLGAMEFLEKPADIDVLIEKIEKAQQRKAELFEKRMEEEMAKLMRKKGW